MKKNMNRVTGICLGVIDMKKSLQFYRDKLGFKTDETGDNPDVVFFCISCDNLFLAVRSLFSLQKHLFVVQ